METAFVHRHWGGCPSPRRDAQRGDTQAAWRGRTWRKVFALPQRRRGWFSFVSPRTGFIADDRGQLLQTEDGGSTWKVVARKTRDLQGAVFVSAKEALLVDYGPPPPDDGQKHLEPSPRLLHSDDGAKTWNAIDAPLQNITAVTALDVDHWWVFANAGCTFTKPKPCRTSRILRTADAGDHWDLIRFPRTLDVVAGSFVTPTVGFAGSPWSGYFRTDDGGVTWRVVYPR